MTCGRSDCPALVAESAATTAFRTRSILANDLQQIEKDLLHYGVDGGGVLSTFNTFVDALWRETSPLPDDERITYFEELDVDRSDLQWHRCDPKSWKVSYVANCSEGAHVATAGVTPSGRRLVQDGTY